MTKSLCVCTFLLYIKSISKIACAISGPSTSSHIYSATTDDVLQHLHRVLCSCQCACVCVCFVSINGVEQFLPCFSVEGISENNWLRRIQCEAHRMNGRETAVKRRSSWQSSGVAVTVPHSQRGEASSAIRISSSAHIRTVVVVVERTRGGTATYTVKLAFRGKK